MDILPRKSSLQPNLCLQLRVLGRKEELLYLLLTRIFPSFDGNISYFFSFSSNKGLNIAGIAFNDSTTSDADYPSSSSSGVFHSNASPSTPDTSLEVEIDKIDTDNAKTPSTPARLEDAIDSAIKEDEEYDLVNSNSDKTVSQRIDNKANYSVQAMELFEGRAEFASHSEGAGWLGDSGNDRATVRSEYMKLFDWTDKSILSSIRSLCDKLYMKGESQQLDRVVDAFCDRWVECNPQHGFKSVGVVYTLAYSILLLNTDHYSEEYSSKNKKMSKSRYVKQTWDAITNLLKAERDNTNSNSGVPTTSGNSGFDDNKTVDHSDDTDSLFGRTRQNSIDSLSYRPSSAMKRRSIYNKFDNVSLVYDTTTYSPREWENLVISMLRSIYMSIDIAPLNLARPNDNSPYGSKNYSHSASSIHSARNNSDNSSLFSRIPLMRRSSWIANDTMSDYEFQDYIANSTFNNSSPALARRSSVYGIGGEANSSIGFSGALRNTLIKEERSQSALGETPDIDNADVLSVTTSIAASLVGKSGLIGKEDELALVGAPWAKEGLLKLQAYSDSNIKKKYKKRDWAQVFVVVQKGYLKVFRFGVPSKRRPAGSTLKYRNNGGDIGGGNWLDKATLTENISLCHCMAQINHIKKNAIEYQHTSVVDQEESSEWSLTLPNYGLLLFRAGTRDIAQEFVYSCNYWAAALSKEPLVEAVSSTEYGWNKPVEILRAKKAENPNYRPHISSGSFDVIIIDGQKIQVKEWKPPVSSSVHSILDEKQQIDSLKHYIETVESSLTKHSEYLADMLQIFPSGHLVSTRAHSNWERRSQYFLKETVKYELYVSTLERALKDKQDTHLFDD